MGEKRGIDYPQVHCGTFIDLSFGGILRRWRCESRIGLRELCRRADIQPGNFCKMEAGELPPPSSAKKCIELFEKIELPKEHWGWMISQAFAFHMGKLNEKFQWDDTRQNNHSSEG